MYKTLVSDWVKPRFVWFAWFVIEPHRLPRVSVVTIEISLPVTSQTRLQCSETRVTLVRT
jgi:hypothetical protein